MIVLLQEIVDGDGDALVMHDGAKPYVVTASGKMQPVRSLANVDTFREVVGQFLPEHLRRVLDEVGGVEYDLPPLEAFPQEQFTVIVACVDDAVHAEIRRRIRTDDLVPDELYSASIKPGRDDDLSLPT